MRNPEIGTFNISEFAERDAVHIAIAPIIAGEDLKPGQRVMLREGLAVADSDGQSIGVVDPFLKHRVLAGTRVWLFLYPNTITSLRHDWTHPALDEAARLHPTNPRRAIAEEWIRGYATEVGLSYDAVMEAAAAHLDDAAEYITLDYDTPHRVWRDAREFWIQFEVLTGRKPEDLDATFIGCPF